MEQEFKKWLISRGYSSTGAAIGYSRAIPQISDHYSAQTGQATDIYGIMDQATISRIAHDYSQEGRFSEFGYEQHGRFRAAIARYSEFFVHHAQMPSQVTGPEGDSEEIDQSAEDTADQTNFAYERDLQTTLCAQISELFPAYRIFGNHNVGVEYSIGGRRIDVLLEHQETQDLLVVELKSGRADYRVFGQISMYMGLLQDQFEDRGIRGIIIAGEIDESLRQACSTTDRIRLNVYRMNLDLEEV